MRLHQENKKLLDGVSFSADHTSNTDFVGDTLAHAIHFIWSGGTSVAGNLYVEGSNVDADAAFVPVDSYSFSGESAGARLVNIERAGYAYIRVRYEYTSGSGGTLTAYLSSKRM